MNTRVHTIAAAGLSISALAAAQTTGPNLLSNPGFESGTANWFPLGPGTLSISSTSAYAGNSSARLSGRTDTWNGIAQSLQGNLTAGKVYKLAVWVRVEGNSAQPIGLTIAQTDDAGTRYINISEGAVVGPGNWNLLTGAFQYAPVGNVSSIFLYAEGPAAGVDLSVDEASVFQATDTWRQESDARIDQLRRRDARLTLTSAGQPVTNATVSVRQTSRAFPFGTAVAADPLRTVPQYAAYITSRFNSITAENAMKWYDNEPQQGAIQYADADFIVNFAQQRNIQIYGHTIFWEVQDWVQPWVQSLSNTALWSALTTRINSVVPRYAGIIRRWDVNNEMLHGSYYTDRLGPTFRPWAFTTARQLDPAAKLFVNDYDTVEFNRSDAYRNQIFDLQQRGAPIDGIGVQCHFNVPVVPQIVKHNLDTLATLNKPIWITEFDVVDQNPQSRADQLERFYRVAFSHPSVEGITMWGFWAGAHWRGPNAALVDQDWTINAAGQRFDALLSEWTTTASGSTNAAGQYQFRGFHGTYELTITRPGQSPIIQTITLPVGSTLLDFAIQLPALCDANCDGSTAAPVLGAADFSCFLAKYRAGDSYANCDGSTSAPVLGAADFSCFLARYRAGC